MTLPHSSLRKAPANLIAGKWRECAGGVFASHNPARTAEVVWQGGSDVAHVAEAVDAARAAQPAWARMGVGARAGVLRRFQQIATARVDAMTALIRDEVGKVTWDARGEAQLLSAKVDVTLDDGADAPRRRVRDFGVQVTPTRSGACTFRAHGVMGVLGPFNFPAHLPNGHIVPALLMGNTIVFKPSDKAPGVGQLLSEFFDEALRAEGAPPGVFNLVQGGADVARALVAPASDIDGVLFTGSWPVGREIMRASLDTPGRMLALEMGGNSATLVMPDADVRLCVSEVLRSAFVTSGQRCTCTRRLVVMKGAEHILLAISKHLALLQVGDPAADVRGEAAPFMGPLVSRGAMEQVLRAQEAMLRAGAEAIAPCRPVRVSGCDGHFVSPGLLALGSAGRFSREDSLDRGAGADVEVFGPLLRVCIAESLGDAIEQVNATRFGLAASIFTKDESAAERFVHEARAGCINVNTGTAGASSKLPFGGLGLSGNHRPAGAFSLDYCAYPVASMVESSTKVAPIEGLTLRVEWL